MAKPKQSNTRKSRDDSTPPSLSDKLFDALTQQEIGQIIDALFDVLSPESQERAISQLPTDTQETIQKLLNPPPAHKTAGATKTPTTSLAKQGQTWTKLWQEWDAIVSEASAEGGEYIVQEVEWEAPYLDTTALVEDLEKIAKQMAPLLPIAFEHGFKPGNGFMEALLEAEDEILACIPDWMSAIDGFYVDAQTTYCALQWEWLLGQGRNATAFDFVQGIRQYEEQFQEVSLDEDAVTDFLNKLTETDERNILAGLKDNHETTLWQKSLADANSGWCQLYLYLIEQYSPDRYQEELRETIPQKWKNGLPIIKALLATQDYAAALVVIEETLQSLLNPRANDPEWIPESTLLVARSGLSYESTENIQELLEYYQKVARELKQKERASALALQLVAIDRSLDWQQMFTAFAEIPLTKFTHKALLSSWRDYIEQKSRPRSWRYYDTIVSSDRWWVPWLIDSITDKKKGANSFNKKITDWVVNLPEPDTEQGANDDLLRLLTKDLTEIYCDGQSRYPNFYQLVIRPAGTSPYDQSRQEYLKLSTSVDLLDLAMNYWKAHLWKFVPAPEYAEKSDYTKHASWMMALKELSPQDYQDILAHWQVVHQRRSNLWKAMQKMGLG